MKRNAAEHYLLSAIHAFGCSYFGYSSYTLLARRTQLLSDPLWALNEVGNFVKVWSCYWTHLAQAMAKAKAKPEVDYSGLTKGMRLHVEAGGPTGGCNVAAPAWRGGRACIGLCGPKKEIQKMVSDVHVDDGWFEECAAFHREDWW